MDLNKLLKQSVEFETNKRAVKLIDFTPEQLQFAAIIFMTAQKEALFMVESHKRLGTDPDHVTVKRWSDEVEMAELFITQIITAQIEVKDRQKIQSN